MEQSKLLTRMSNSVQSLVIPGVQNPIAAQIAELVGFESVFVSGHCLSAVSFGRPDVGITTLTEMIDATRYIVNAVKVPVLVDGDTGYGGLINVRHTVREYENLNVAGIQFEDQVFPKRCGYLEGGNLAPVIEMQRRVSVAAETKNDPDFVIIARTEGRMVEDFSEAIERALAYKNAGADWIFVNGLSSVEQVTLTAEKIPGPQVYNYSGTGKDPLHTVAEIAEAGFQIILFPNILARTAVKAMYDMLNEIKKSGDFNKISKGEVYDFENWKELIGVNEFMSFEQRTNQLLFDK